MKRIFSTIALLLSLLNVLSLGAFSISAAEEVNEAQKEFVTEIVTVSTPAAENANVSFVTEYPRQVKEGDIFTVTYAYAGYDFTATGVNSWCFEHDIDTSLVVLSGKEKTDDYMSVTEAEVYAVRGIQTAWVDTANLGNGPAKTACIPSTESATAHYLIGAAQSDASHDAGVYTSLIVDVNYLAVSAGTATFTTINVELADNSFEYYYTFTPELFSIEIIGEDADELSEEVSDVVVESSEEATDVVVESSEEAEVSDVVVESSEEGSEPVEESDEESCDSVEGSEDSADIVAPFEESESAEEVSEEPDGGGNTFPGGISKPKPQEPKPYVEPTAWDLFYEKFITYGGWETVVDGLITTLKIALLGLLIGIVLGTLIAAAKVVPKTNILIKILSVICDIYVALFRGTPIVVQLLIGYFVLFPALGVQIEALIAAIAIFGMNSGAYISEIMRSGIQSVDGGQLEAARAVGLSFSVSMIKVVIPQAIKNILPTLGNEFIVLIKETSVASFITVVDLTKAFKDIANSNYEYIIPYLMLALVYLVLVMIITLGIKLLERRLAKVDRGR